MGVSSSESHDLTAFYEMLSASFGVLSQNTGFYPSLDRIIETTLGPLNLGPGGRSYNEPISRLHWTKTFPTQKVGKLIPNKVPDRHWQVISVDMIRELPDSKGYNAVLMVVDRLSKWIHAIPTVTSLDSAGVARLFLEHVWRHHRLLEEVISDHV